MLVRGFYYEGWHPHGKPVKERHKADFLAHVAKSLEGDFDIDPENVARAVLQVLSTHVSRGEIESVQGILAADIRSMWA